MYFVLETRCITQRLVSMLFLQDGVMLKGVSKHSRQPPSTNVWTHINNLAGVRCWLKMRPPSRLEARV